MRRDTRSARLAVLVFCALASGGCVERVIQELGQCGDGVLAPGDLCFAAGDAKSAPATPGLTSLSIRGEDFTGDGWLDVLVMGTDQSGVVAGVTLAGLGDGTFAPPVNAGLAGCSAHPVPGLVNADAAVDLLVDECSESVSLFLGAPQGRFTGRTEVPVGVFTRSSGLIDLTNDGVNEVVVLGTTNDGRAALSVSSQQGGSAALVALDGLGTVGGVPFDPVGFGIADINSGNARVVLIDPTGVGGLAVMGHPLMRPEPPQRLQVPFTPKGAAIGDFDEDGEDEILVGSSEDRALITLEIEEPGAAPREIGRTEAEVNPLSRQIADVDGDGHLDLVMSQADSTDLLIFRGQGDGTFDPPLFVDVGIVPEQFFLADLNGDSAPDVVAAQFVTQTIVVLLADP